ncbi:uncharacterized protein BYT42DRAFT_609497 [Radiomyces spectabilis]|uniref:uncharacterized protein n=1 Tax=Radiomyces spectabilis TaxID=64574 RepID=UPI0022200002|nr:uncharacterized protein BYT42DRAFT_609497 [Radiomyces spectabilis]KAI8393726.1 hypothetical protein BYT42DRAFT_609497 [Radiomyces spectabilis]
MVTPLLKPEVNSRAHMTCQSPTSPLIQSPSHRRAGSSHLFPDTISLELGNAQRRDKQPSYLFVKDKLLQSTRWPYYFPAIRNNCNRYTYRTQSFSTIPRYLKVFLLIVCFFLILSYVPLFSFVRETDLSETNTTPSPLSAAAHAKPRLWRSGSTTATTTRNQIILYRIIGNDLPPRHKDGQTLSNLRFILEHEQNFPDTKKIFVLNRIADAVRETALIELLDQFHMDYIRIPFVEREYQQLDFRLEDFPEPDFLHSDYYRRFSKVSKLRALDYTYHDKNVYAMNNNGGRNAALHHARTIPNARWIMPFDGNCYLSANGFQEIKTQLDRYGHNTKYFIVPMTRLLNNSILLDGVDERPKTPEEPQIMFRYDANEEYNLNMRYGRRSKLELLWRLGALENRRLNRPIVPWEFAERSYSQDKGNFRTIGWVYRLFSGNQQQEENKKEASSYRAFNRLLAIQASLDHLDETIARRHFRQDKLFLFDEKAMVQLRYRYWSKDTDINAMMQQLAKVANDILKKRDETYAAATAAEGDENTSILAANLSMVELTQQVTTLTLAYYYLGDEQYGRYAADLVRIHMLKDYTVKELESYKPAQMLRDTVSHHLDFLFDQGYSFPSLHHSTWTTPKQPNLAILATSDLSRGDLSPLLDCLRLLRRAEMLTHKDYLDLQVIAAELLENLITSPTGIHLAQLADYRGILYDLQVTALASFTDDVRLFLRVANRCRTRIGKQFTADGAQPYQESSTYARFSPSLADSSSSDTMRRILLHYETLNLQYWTLLTRGIQNMGIAKDIWHYTAKNGARVSHAVVAHLKKHATLVSQAPEKDAAFITSRLRPLVHLANAAFAASNHSLAPADQAWMDQHRTLFGDPWVSELEAQTNNLASDDGSLEVAVSNHQLNEDQIQPREGIPQFWMLSIAS